MKHGQPFKRVMLKPSVLRLSMEEVTFAIEHGGDDNLILRELGNIVEGYLEESRRGGGEALQGLAKITPTCPIEEVALQRAIAAVKEKTEMNAS